jgi:hypothetical protein
MLSRKTLFEFSAEPFLLYVGVLRELVESTFRTSIADPALESRALIGAHELLENALLRATGKVFRFQVDMVFSEPPYIELSTRNTASDWDRAMVQRVVKELSAAADPAVHYREMMIAIANQVDSGCLGLGRIRAEAGMELSCEVVDETISVFARLTLSSS